MLVIHYEKINLSNHNICKDEEPADILVARTKNKQFDGELTLLI